MATHKTKQAALEAARKALGNEAIENVDFTIKNTGAGYTHEEMPPVNDGAKVAAAKRTNKPKAEPKPKAAAKPKAEKKAPAPKKAAAPKAAPTPKADGPTKTERMVAMLKKPGGATSAEMEAALGWQPHSVRGLLGTMRKNGTNIVATKVGKEPTYYEIKEGPAAPEAQPTVGDVL